MGLLARFGQREGALATTGYPMLKRGTAQPLYLEVVEGNIDLSDIAHDIYALSHLAFASPGSCMSLPFTIALADYILRESHPGKEDSLWEDEEQEQVERSTSSQMALYFEKGGVVL
jgi:argonaute-like protein implicated in RNA metabolism and viral defense